MFREGYFLSSFTFFPSFSLLLFTLFSITPSLLSLTPSYNYPAPLFFLPFPSFFPFSLSFFLPSFLLLLSLLPSLSFLPSFLPSFQRIKKMRVNTYRLSCLRVIIFGVVIAVVSLLSPGLKKMLQIAKKTKKTFFILFSLSK